MEFMDELIDRAGGQKTPLSNITNLSLRGGRFVPDETISSQHLND
jgi:hypothetical protein